MDRAELIDDGTMTIEKNSDLLLAVSFVCGKIVPNSIFLLLMRYRNGFIIQYSFVDQIFGASEVYYYF